MKKLISAVAALSVMIAVSSAYAVESVTILLKNHADLTPIAISSDVSPDIKNNRTMVPLRVISESLGATVNWLDPEVVLTQNNVAIVLQLNSHTAVINDTTVQLDVKPYLKNNRTMVPLRLIAEAFDCDVRYSDNVVTVETKPLVIDGVKVHTLQQEYRMTMGGVVNQINGNTYNGAIYNIFAENRGKKVEAPSSYTWSSHPSSGEYYKAGQYDFLDLEGNSIKRFDIYTLVRTEPTEGDPEVLIYEANENQWYMFHYTASQDIWRLVDTARMNGFLTEISNTVP